MGRYSFKNLGTKNIQLNISQSMTRDKLDGTTKYFIKQVNKHFPASINKNNSWFYLWD